MPWSTSTGRRTDYVGVITGSRFEHTEFEGGGSNNSLRLTFLLDDGSEWNENYSIGGKWFPSPDGGMAEHEDGLSDAGEYRTFSKQSWYGAFLDAAMALVPIEVLQERGDPVEANIWLGMKFKMSECEHPRQKDRETGKPLVRNLPVEYLGTESTPSEQVEGLMSDLRDIAWAVADHNEFIEKALTLPGVEGNNTLVMQIADPDGLYKEITSGERDSDREATPSS